MLTIFRFVTGPLVVIGSAMATLLYILLLLLLLLICTCRPLNHSTYGRQLLPPLHQSIDQQQQMHMMNPTEMKASGGQILSNHNSPISGGICVRCLLRLLMHVDDGCGWNLFQTSSQESTSVSVITRTAGESIDTDDSRWTEGGVDERNYKAVVRIGLRSRGQSALLCIMGRGRMRDHDDCNSCKARSRAIARKLLLQPQSSPPPPPPKRAAGNSSVDVFDNFRKKSHRRSRTGSSAGGGVVDMIDYSRPNTHPPKNN